jgi:hypothetical protein
MTRAAFHSDMETKGLGRTGGQAPSRESGAPEAQGLTARPSSKPFF